MVHPIAPLLRSARLLSAFALFFASVSASAQTESTRFFYTFGQSSGGVAEVSIQTDPPQWSNSRPLISEGLSQPKKLVVSSSGQQVLVTTEESSDIWIIDAGEEPKLTATLKLAYPTNEVAALGQTALVASDEDFFYQIDLSQGKIAQTWSAKQELSPPGNKGESILFLPDRGVALIPFQKDSGKGKRLGNRLLVLDLKVLGSRADLQLPRNRPDLHFSDNRKEQGPNPELVFASEKHDTVILSLDLYGAMAFAKLSAALEGKWQDLDYVPTALDESWGNSFPDRGLLFPMGDKDYLLVSNAAQEGGFALFDVAERKVIQTFPAPAGGETPVFLPKTGQVVTVVSGKIKSRGGAKLEKVSSPESDLYIWNMTPLAEGNAAELEKIPLNTPLHRIQAVAPKANGLLFLVMGRGMNELGLYDLETRTFLHREPALGPVNRVAVWRKEGS